MARHLGRSRVRAAALLGALAAGCVSRPEPAKPAAVAQPAAPPAPMPVQAPTDVETPKAQDAFAAVPGQIRVDLSWRDQEQDVRRTVDDRVITDDADLESALREARTRHASDTEPLVIYVDAHGEVPWKDVVKVINTCDRVGIKRIEFGFDKTPPDCP